MQTYKTLFYLMLSLEIEKSWDFFVLCHQLIVSDFERVLYIYVCVHQNLIT